MPRDPARLAAAFPRLTELLLNATLTPWAHMQEITAPMQEITAPMPRLEAVEMGYNHLTDLAPSAKCAAHPGIRAINLEGNECADWAVVCGRLQEYQSQVGFPLPICALA